MASETEKRVLSLVKSQGPIRSCDLDRHGVARKDLNHKVWMAIDPKARRSRVSYPHLWIVRFSGRALTKVA